MLAAIGLSASDIHAPAQPVIQQFFSISVEQTKEFMSLFFVGTIISSLFTGILSDLHGRRPYIILAVSIFALGSIITVATNSFEYFLLARFFQGLGLGAIGVVCFAVIQDSAKEGDSSRLFAHLGIVLVLVPTISPIIGGTLLEAFGWRSIFVFVLVLSIFSLIISLFLLPETNTDLSKTKSFFHIGRSIRDMIKHPVFSKAVLIYPFLSIGYWAFITESAFVFHNVFNLDVSIYKYLISLVVLMFVIANIATIVIKKDRSISPLKLVTAGLLISLLGAFLFVISSYKHNLFSFLISNMSIILGLGVVYAPLTSITLASASYNKGLAASIRSSLNMTASFVGVTLTQFFPYSKSPFNRQFILLCSLIGCGLWFLLKNHLTNTGEPMGSQYAC